MRTLPGPRGLPVLGSILAFGPDPLAFLDDAKARYGDSVRYRLGPYPCVQLSHPDAIEEVLVGQHKAFVKDQGTRDLVSVLGEGLLTADGDHWRRNRRLIAPLLQRGKIGRYAAPMVTIAERLADEVARSGADGSGGRDVRHDLMSLTFKIVMKTLFSADAGGDLAKVERDVDAVMVEFARTVQSWVRVLPAWVPVPGRRRFVEAVSSLHALTQSLINERQAAPKGGEELISRLLDARDDSGRVMTVPQLRDEALTMILAGHETTALALTYALWLLARHPDVQARMHDEISATLRGAPPTAEDVERLPLTLAVFREVLRLYPPAWLIGREVVAEPDRTGPLRLSSVGHTLPAGSQVLMPQWVVHRDPRWWPAPLAFKPERWLTPDTGRPRFAYFPFGGGPRVCIGNHFAEMEGVLMLAVLAARLEFRPVEGSDVLSLLPSVTLRPKGPVPVKIVRRAV